ncbi:unnamed protein product [Ambrosiozyma monospora]|uniref:Unnamed protein product n=1 Tax=Ambrosiozyma monospora TaxID=43982 RepID=A0ACB5T4U4_AMBMO|nr:unnamed protein product [Ambrosiozyma monospora]
MPPRSSSNRRRGKIIPPRRNNSNNAKSSSSSQQLPHDLIKIGSSGLNTKSNSTISGELGDPSKTLQALLDETNLEYDSSLGILQGDAIQSKPSRSKLINMKRLLEKLIRELDAGIRKDEEELNKLSHSSSRNGAKTKTSAAAAAHAAALEHQRLQKNSIVKNEKLDDLLSLQIPKKRQHGEIDDLSSSKNDRLSKNKTKVKVNLKDKLKIKEEDDDEDDVSLVKRKKRNIILTANGERREITPTALSFDTNGDDKDDDDGSDKDDKPLKDRTSSVNVKSESDKKLILSIKKESGKSSDSGTATDSDSGKTTEKKKIDDYVPSVYLTAPKTKFDIPKMLDPAVEALHLFNDEKAKKEAPNVHEYNKKKFAVAEYPPNS